MANPLLMLAERTLRRRTLRRARVQVPTEVPGTDAIFFVMRRMRAPIIVVISVFAISVLGLALIPGVDDEGNPYRMSVFDAFYFMSYTATTIGFGELPYTFTYAQRLWTTGAIYASVVGWAYSVGALFALLADESFRDAIAIQRFRRAVHRMREPFFIVAGYGQAGRTLAHALDERGRRLVVIDNDRTRVDRLATDQLMSDVPGLEADVANPGVLGLAGLGHDSCAGVLAVTDNDEANLAVTMAVNLLRPDLEVITRAQSREMADNMADFSPTAVINPYDRFGAYLTLALQRPVTFQLVTWLMSEPGEPLPELRHGLANGRWVVLADDRFGEEVAADLAAAGLDVTRADPAAGDPDLTGAIGLVAGSKSDTTNLALAAHARISHPDLYLAVRQESHQTAPLLAAFSPDSVFFPSDLVVREIIARIVTPTYWGFIEQVLAMDDKQAAAVRDRLIATIGERGPHDEAVTISTTDAPAAARWAGRQPLTIDDLLRHPENRDERLPLVPLAIVREGDVTYLPDGDHALELDDRVLLAGRSAGYTNLSITLFHDHAVEYVATGVQRPQTWLWRRLTKNRRHTR